MKLSGVAEIAGLLGVSRQRAGQISRERGFPEPVDRLSMGPVWKEADVRRWAKRVGRTLTAAILAAFFLSTPTGLAATIPVAPGEITVHRTQCPYFEKATYGSVACAGASEIWVPPGASPGTYWHELGHLFDQHVLTDAHRDHFRRIIRDSRPWTSDEGRDTPAERFAETYALCALQARGRSRAGVVWFSRRGRPAAIETLGYGFRMTWRAQQRTCQLIWNAAGLPYRVTAVPPARSATRADRRPGR